MALHSEDIWNYYRNAGIPTTAAERVFVSIGCGAL